MTDFKVLVKVDPSNVVDTLITLGEKVTGDRVSFFSIDPIWAAQQDFLTAVPVEIALTVEMREVVQTNSPDTKFIVTGVKAANVDRLINEYGYTAWPPKPVDVDQSEEDKVEDLPAKEESHCPAPAKHTLKYFYNGREISKKEFDEKAKDLGKQVEEVFGRVDSILEDLSPFFRT